MPVAVLCTACTRVELVNKADAYDAAIWDSNNRQILLNAVRASQRAPMSFVGLGEVSANPVFSGTTGGTLNFIPSGLTGYSLNPSISYGGGFATFQMNNLNHEEFAAAMHRPLDDVIIEYFISGKWPKEVVDRVLIQLIVLSPAEYANVQRLADLRCKQSDLRSVEICDQIAADKQAARERNCPEPRATSAGLEFLNTAREFCPMSRFVILLRTLRLLEHQKYHRRLRSAEGILYHLGELIAAQNYSAQPYEPKVLLAGPDGRHHLVNLFVVKRGAIGASAAVQVNFDGENFFIPKPQLGAVEEDRSLQVLDLATTAIVLATRKDSLPKSNNFNLVTTR